MFITSTILYFGENPVGYDLYREENGYIFKPAIDSKAYLTPEIRVTGPKGAYEISGVEQEDVVGQVRHIISMDALLDLRGQMSAAS